MPRRAPRHHTPEPRADGPPDPPRAAPYLDPYRKAVEAFGPSFEATLWNSREWQTARFEVMRRMIHFEGRTVIDAGAGQGDLAAFLVEHNIEYARYIALEAMPEMSASGRARNLPRAEFHELDFVADETAFSRFAGAPGRDSQVDAVVFSGSLNTLEQSAAEAVLDRAWRSCREALVFNFLSDRHDKRHLTDTTGPARRFNTLRAVDWALDRTPGVRFRHDYFTHGHDATICMLRRD